MGLIPAAASASPNSENSLGKKVRTAWPKMIGSGTFIIVAFRCSENSTSSALARAICSVRNASSFGALIVATSTISPAITFTGSRRVVVVPSSATSSMRSESSAGMTTDFSVERKSPSVMCATFVLESGDHLPMLCGCVRAYCFTAPGARRSELPSRSTGFTALPSTLP